jgi:hypothetical protein
MTGLIKLTINQDEIQGLEPLTLCAQQVQPLRDMLAECKRLKEITGTFLEFRIAKRRVNESPDAPQSPAPPLITFSWLSTSTRVPLPACARLSYLIEQLCLITADTGKGRALGVRCLSPAMI